MKHDREISTGQRWQLRNADKTIVGEVTIQSYVDRNVIASMQLDSASDERLIQLIRELCYASDNLLFAVMQSIETELTNAKADFYNPQNNESIGLGKRATGLVVTKRLLPDRIQAGWAQLD